MKNIVKKLFGTPLKATLSIISLTAIVAILGTGTVFAAGTIAQNSSIGEEKAKSFSFADAGVDPTAAKEVQIEFEYEQGQYVYEIEFIADGTEYEYWINASDGTVVKKEIETVTLDGTNTTAAATITLEDAKKVALSDAKLTENAVTFTTAKLDEEDGASIYEIEFYAENVEYEYEINAGNGTIHSKSKEIITENKQKTSTETAKQPAKSEAKDNTSKANQKDTKDNNSSAKSETSKPQASANQITLATAKEKALADADVTASSVTFTEAKLDYEDGINVYDIEFYTSSHEYEYEINAVTGAVHDKSVEALEKKENKGTESKATGKTVDSSNYIGVDKAKSIAVNHAGLSISEVTFSKAKLDNDDGNTLYEIEFYKDGIEYEYEVDASSGKILEYDKEHAD